MPEGRGFGGPVRRVKRLRSTDCLAQPMNTDNNAGVNWGWGSRWVWVEVEKGKKSKNNCNSVNNKKIFLKKYKLVVSK